MSKSLWWIAALILLTAGIVIWLLNSGQPMSLVVLFDDVGGLEKGDPVRWKTFTVGKVHKIEPLVDRKVGVTIRIRDEYRSSITHGTEFVLHQAGFLGLSGENAIEAITPAETGPPFSEGEKIAGRSSPKPSLVEQGKTWTLDSWRRLTERTAKVLEEFESSPQRAEIERALSEAGRLAGAAARQAGEEAERFWRDHRKDLDRIIERLEAIRKELLKSGDEAGAKRIQVEVEELQQRRR